MNRQAVAALALQDQAMEAAWSRKDEIEAIIVNLTGRIYQLTSDELLLFQCATTLMGYLYLTKATEAECQ